MKTRLIALLLLLVPLVAFGEPSPPPVPDKLQVALADMVNKSEDFLVAQLPDAMRQLLLWKFFEHLIPMLVALLVASILTKMASSRAGDLTIVSRPPPNRLYDTVPMQEAANGWPRFVFASIRVVAALIAWITFLNYANLKWLQIWVAPKVYLVEYVKTMVTGH